MTPSTGAWRARSTSSMVLTLVSRYSMKKARPTPTIRPMTMPRMMFSVLLGRTGLLPGLAWSMMVTMDVLGISKSSLFGRDLRLKQLVKINHVFQLAFQLPSKAGPVRLLPGPFVWRPRPWRLCASSAAFNDFTCVARPAMMPLTRSSISVFNSSANFCWRMTSG